MGTTSQTGAGGKKRKTKKKDKKLISPSEKAGKQSGGDFFDTVVGTAAEAFTEHALPWMGKKTVEMGRYGASEAYEK